MATGERQREASLCDKSKQSAFLSTFYRQKLSCDFCDVVMKVCNREIHAHSNILAAASPYFESFLALEIPRQFSQKSPQIIEIQIDGSEPNLMYEEAVEAVINYIYTGAVTVSEHNISQVYEIGKIMQLEDVLQFCEEFLQGQIEDQVVYTQQHHLVSTSVNTDVCGKQSFSESQKEASLLNKSAYLTSVLAPRSKYKKVVSVSCQTTPTDGARRKQTTEKSTCTELRIISAADLNRKRKLSTSALTQSTPVLTPYDNTGLSLIKRLKLSNSISPVIRSSTPIKTQQYHEESQLSVHIAPDTPVVATYTSPQKFQSSPRSAASNPSPAESTNLDNADHEDDGSNGNFVQAVKELKSDDQDMEESVGIDKNDEDGMNLVAEEKQVHIEVLDYNKLSVTDVSQATLHITTVQDDVTSPAADCEGQSVDRRSPGAPDPTPGLPGTEVRLEEVKHIAEADHSEENDENIQPPETDIVPGTSSPPEQTYHPYITMQTPYISAAAKRRGRPRKDPITTKTPKSKPEGSSVEYEKATKEYFCTECDFSTTKVRGMSSHMMSHKLDQGVCFYCDAAIPDPELLKQHMTSHGGNDTPFSCKHCHLKFKTRTMLNLHLPKHSDDKPFICEVCCMSFKWKHALKNHMVTHSNKREHLCDICGYSTAHKAQLKSHHLIHTGDTYKCQFEGCKFETTKKQNLRYHTITHTLEKPHQCEICGQNFSLLKNMKRHMLLHFSEQQHRCKSCEFASTRYDKLKEHLLKQHGQGTPPERRVKVADMLATANLNLHVQDRFVPSSDPQTVIIEPETVTLAQLSNAARNSSAGGDTYAILHKLLLGNVGKDGQQLLISKVEDGNSLTEEGVAILSEAEVTTDPALDTVTSIMVSEDGGEVMCVGAGGDLISGEELATKLGLPDTTSLNSLLLKHTAQGIEGEQVQIVATGDMEGVHSQQLGETLTLTPAQNSTEDSPVFLVTTTGDHGDLVTSGDSKPLVTVGDTYQYMEVLVPQE